MFPLSPLSPNSSSSFWRLFLFGFSSSFYFNHTPKGILIVLLCLQEIGKIIRCCIFLIFYVQTKPSKLHSFPSLMGPGKNIIESISDIKYVSACLQQENTLSFCWAAMVALYLTLVSMSGWVSDGATLDFWQKVSFENFNWLHDWPHYQPWWTPWVTQWPTSWSTPYDWSCDGLFCFALFRSLF